ncbi:hypothetical protein C8A05DRAFT_39758 [Staphylotrichum tortipilum]|uniref:Uncharacterized protein n=1 Tax=Staphylotrichum tortipilum TaxID=2831512 RepID=A0AAN6MA85_9PEZI|nr:hypothetical protein C8A05DRAFT_39758 [Staphylotrichum longicolle]
MTPRFGPVVDGVLWSRIRPREEDVDGPKARILSVPEFTLKPGIDIHDECGLPQKLWKTTLRYIGSVPGCCAIEWGSRMDNHAADRTSILRLVHWDSTAAWRMFQHSPGFTPIIGLLDSDVSNRCAKLGRPGARGLGYGGDAQDRATVVDVVSVIMATEDGRL